MMYFFNTFAVILLITMCLFVLTSSGLASPHMASIFLKNQEVWGLMPPFAYRQNVRRLRMFSILIIPINLKAT